MTVKAHVARGAMALGATRIVTNLASTGALIVLARLLTPDDFGVVAIGTMILGIIVALTELSLGSALIQRSEVTQDHVDTAWTMAALRALAITGGFALAAWPLALLYGDMRLAPVFLVSGATGALTGLVNPRVALQTKAMRFGPSLVLQLMQKLSGLAISIGLALATHSYWAIVAGNALGALLSTGLSYILVPYRPRFTLSRSADLMHFSGWMFVSQVANVVTWRFDQLVIGLFLPRAQLGAYSVADSLSAIPSRETTTPIVQALFPGFSRMQDDNSRLRKAYLTAQGAIGLVALPAGFGLGVLADPVVRLALGERWLMAIPLVEVLAFTYAIQTMTTGARPLAMALGDTRALFVRDMVGLVLRVAFVTAGLALAGLTGMLWGRAIVTVIGLFISFALVRKVLGLSIGAQVWLHRRTLIAVGAMAGAVSAGDKALMAHGAGALERLALLVPAGGLAFCTALATLWMLEGRKAGAETEVFTLARNTLRRRTAKA